MGEASYVGGLERQEENPTVDVLDRLAKTLAVTNAIIVEARRAAIRSRCRLSSANTSSPHASAPFARSAAEHHARPNQFDPAVGVARRLFEAARKTVHHALNHGRAIPPRAWPPPRVGPEIRR